MSCAKAAIISSEIGKAMRINANKSENLKL